jgi:glyoxylase-like metal-dependent hydrolase (beta-lactamase superfamily II)
VFERSGSPAINRRAIVKAALGGVVGLTLAPFARSAFAQGSPAIVPVSDGFVMLTGAGGNILVRTASAGQVLVDSGAARFTDAVLARLRGLPGAGRVETVFNTHWHLEQVGGNLALGRSGATIIAHEKTRAHLATDYYLQHEDRYEKALLKEAHPTKTIFDRGETLAGGQRIEYGHLLEAHTDGDIYVFFLTRTLTGGWRASLPSDPGWTGSAAAGSAGASTRSKNSRNSAMRRRGSCRATVP